MIYENLPVLDIELPQAPPPPPPIYFLGCELNSGSLPIGSPPNFSPLSSASHNSRAQPGRRENRAWCMQGLYFHFQHISGGSEIRGSQSNWLPLLQNFFFLMLYYL